jgi:membrane protein implicated in regulation of membrane protease activity
MSMTHVGWWIVALLLVVAEMMTGTVYVLMVAIGCAAGGVAALLGASATLQTVAVIVVGVSSLGLWHRHRMQRGPRPGDAQTNPDVILDIGAVVDVAHWHEGHARVNYRGSQWDAEPEFPHAPVTGRLVVKAVRGATLVLGAEST